MGDRRRYGGILMSQEDIICFAREFDPQYFHTDPLAARDSAFGGIVASGWHTTAVLMWRGLKRPGFVIVDGAPGLEAALSALWGDDLPDRR